VNAHADIERREAVGRKSLVQRLPLREHVGADANLRNGVVGARATRTKQRHEPVAKEFIVHASSRPRHLPP
jgi:hypothetical protein